MFKIDANNLPIVRTRRALLVLDLQNDFIATGGPLQVETPSNFVDKILTLAPEFRNSDSIIWIRSVFKESRAINEPHGESESVITDREVIRKHLGAHKHHRERAGLAQKLLQIRQNALQADEDEEDNGSEILADGDAEDTAEETFLTMPEGQVPQVALHSSPGANFAPAVSSSIDGKKDMIFEKTWYSAFKDGRLVQILRAKFVTEIYLCGALTNMSVFATAMDAARYGYAITLVEDCLGYRNRPRHDEALRKLAEFTGCNMISSEDLIQESRRKSQAPQLPVSRHSRPPPRQKSSGLENLMAKMQLKTESSVTIVDSGSSAVPSRELIEAESPTADDESPQIPPKSEVKRERVQSKIKTRRRRSRTEAREVTRQLEGSNASSTTTAIVQTTSLEVEKSAAEGELNPNTTISNSPAGIEEAMANLKVTHDGPSSNEPARLEHEDKVTLLCEGDTTIIPNLLDGELSTGIFDKVRDEVQWQKMSHQGGEVPRLVAVQGEVAEDGSIPIYRHPADDSPPLLPFSATVSLIREQVEKELGHSVNHVLIQFYRDGTDYISEHSDKTLDIMPKTYIANVSLGAQRTMVFRTKKLSKTEDTTNSDPPPRQAIRAPLPHNSMCKMGLMTNMRWLHSIRQDKRMASEKTEAELAYNVGRISLTFRSIGTFLDKSQCKIWGQGAIAKTKDQARTVINGDAAESEKMIRAFGQENHASEFEWEKIYGVGFDVLHISNIPKLFLSGDFVADVRVKLMLAECGIEWVEGKMSSSFDWKTSNTSWKDAVPKETTHSSPVKFIDNDVAKSVVMGDLAILLYLDSVYGPIHSHTNTPPSSGAQVSTPVPAQIQNKADIARQFTRLQQSEDLLHKYRTKPAKDLKPELEIWEKYASEAEGGYVAGKEVSIVDFAVWPVLRVLRVEMRQVYGELIGESERRWNYEALDRYLDDMGGRDSVKKVIGGIGGEGIGKGKGKETDTENDDGKEKGKGKEEVTEKGREREMEDVNLLKEKNEEEAAERGKEMEKSKGKEKRKEKEKQAVS